MATRRFLSEAELEATVKVKILEELQEMATTEFIKKNNASGTPATSVKRCVLAIAAFVFACTL